MSLEQFLEQLRVVGVIGAYTTAFLFLSWSIWQAWVLWIELKIKTSREIYEDKSAKIRSIEYMRASKEYKDWESRSRYNPNASPHFYENNK